MTGTPIQNKLLEYWALVNWATNGSLLGTRNSFKKYFADPIVAGQDPKVCAQNRMLYSNNNNNIEFHYYKIKYIHIVIIIIEFKFIIKINNPKK